MKPYQIGRPAGLKSYTWAELVDILTEGRGINQIDTIKHTNGANLRPREMLNLFQEVLSRKAKIKPATNE